MNQYDLLIENLENEELDSPSVSPNLYVRLFAAYLLRNKLTEAKHLWHRIPLAVKSENKELERLHYLLHTLSTNNSSEFFKNIEFGWSNQIKPMMNSLLQDNRGSVLQLIGNTYTSILESNLMKLTRMTREQLAQTYSSLNWTCETDNQCTVVFPVRPKSDLPPDGQSEYQLFALTKFVSFLEN